MIAECRFPEGYSSVQWENRVKTYNKMQEIIDKNPGIDELEAFAQAIEELFGPTPLVGHQQDETGGKAVSDDDA